MLFRIILLLLTTLFTMACSSQDDLKRSIRVACVGDSIAYGLVLKDRIKNAYPSQLDKLLGSRYSVENFGKSGATLLINGDRPYIKSREFAASLEFKPDIVVIMLGTNDTKEGNWIRKEQLDADYLDLIKKYRRGNRSVKILIALPPPIYSDYCGMSNSKIEKVVIPVIQKVAQKSGIIVVDNYSPLREKRLFKDGVHPSSEGSYIIAQQVYREIRKLGDDR